MSANPYRKLSPLYWAYRAGERLGRWVASKDPMVRRIDQALKNMQQWLDDHKESTP